MREGQFTLKELYEADEVFAMSSTRGLLPVSAIGDVSYDTQGPMLVGLKGALAKLEADMDMSGGETI